MRINLTEGDYLQIIYGKEEDILLNGELMTPVGAVNEGMNDDGRWECLIFESESGRFFEVPLYYTKLGYNHYELQMHEQSFVAHEVTERTVTKKIWERTQ